MAKCWIYNSLRGSVQDKENHCCIWRWKSPGLPFIWPGLKRAFQDRMANQRKPKTVSFDCRLRWDCDWHQS